MIHLSSDVVETMYQFERQAPEKSEPHRARMHRRDLNGHNDEKTGIHSKPGKEEALGRDRLELPTLADYTHQTLIVPTQYPKANHKINEKSAFSQQKNI